MKFNTKRTVLVGFAFFLILLFWQVYDSIIPKILTDKFGMSQFWSGIVMALDNVLAVFLLPVFGALSDRTSTKIGRRTPYILVGTLIAAVLFVSLSFADNMQLTALDEIVAITEDGTSPEKDAALLHLYRSDVSFVPAEHDADHIGKTTLADLFGGEDAFLAASADPVSYSTYVVPARQAYAWQMTLENPVTLIVFMVLLLLVLLSMAIFRSPAVALMPDVTPKPLRSKGNAIINLMGCAGGILVLVLGIVFGTGKTSNALMSYTTFFLVNAVIMLAALGIFLCTVREKKWAKEAEEISRAHGITNDTGDDEPLPGSPAAKSVRLSLIFLLLSVALWYMGYNAVSSKYSVYAGSVLGLDYNLTLIVAQAAAIVSYLPVGILSHKFGRKKMILAGVVLLGIAFTAASFMRNGSNLWVMNGLFCLAGIGWATINVNSYPMVVELASAEEVGKYTGYYYTASMLAQIITPVLSGFFLTYLGMTTLFPYAALFVAAALLTMLFVKHGDVVPENGKQEN